MCIIDCNQNAMDDEGFKVSNKKFADFIAKKCVKQGLVIETSNR